MGLVIRGYSSWKRATQSDWEADTEGSDDICDTNQELQSPGWPEYHFRAGVLALGGPEYSTEGAFVGVSWDIGRSNQLILTPIGDSSNKRLDKGNKVCFKVVKF